jgi:hemerythrin superfamily protein
MATTSTGNQKKTAAKAPKRNGMDAVKLLKQDHREVEDLFDSFEKARSDGQKEKLATQICAMLKVHAAIEEEIFYPAAKAEIGDPDLIDEAQVEHNSAKQLIAEIEAGGPDDDLWEAKVKVLSEYIKHHVKEEEGEMFPEARKSELDLQALGEQMMARKQELMQGDGSTKPSRR